jgi:hypothetical protein
VSSIVPDIFIILSAAALLLALVAFWQSLRGLFSEDNRSASVDAPGGYPGRGTVLFERRKLQQTIEDIRSERDMGRLSQSDFDALNRELRDREKEILKLLDTDQQSTREQARKLIEEHLMPRFDRAESPSENRAAKPRTCDNCGERNDSDARYCKRCGDELDVEVEA